MLKFLRNWGAPKSKTPTTPRDPLEDVPRYPPYARGFPATEVEDLLQSQQMLVKQTINAMGWRPSMSDQLVMPILRNFAAYVHHLPASAAHHHRYAGGLFRHGLEVAHWAVTSSRGVIFAGRDTGERRRILEPRWRYLVFLAAIFHDIGKAVVDMRVTDRSGSLEWVPYSEPLLTWLKANNIDRYFISWSSGQHKIHESFGKYAENFIITSEARAFLRGVRAKEIEIAYSQCLAGAPLSEEACLVYKLVQQADRDSVEIDLQKNRDKPVGDETGTPVARYVCDAMRRLVREKKWTVNRPGALVWATPEGVHIVWRHAVKDIVELLAKDKVAGIPRDPNTLADILFERNHAQRPVDEDGVERGRYWEMVPDIFEKTGRKGVSLGVIRLDSPGVIYDSDEPPSPTTARFYLPGELPEAAEQETPGATETAPDTPAEAAEAESGRGSETNGVADAIKDPPGTPTQEKDLDGLRERLRAEGRAGEFLLALGGDIENGKLVWDKHVFAVKGEVLLRYPQTLQAYSDKARELLAALNAKRWVTTHVLEQQKLVQERRVGVDTLRVVVLNSFASSALLALTGKSDPAEVLAGFETISGTVEPTAPAATLLQSATAEKPKKARRRRKKKGAGGEQSAIAQEPPETPVYTPEPAPRAEESLKVEAPVPPAAAQEEQEKRQQASKPVEPNAPASERKAATPKRKRVLPSDGAPVTPENLTHFLEMLRDGHLGVPGQEIAQGIRFPLNGVVQKSTALLNMPRFMLAKNLREEDLALPTQHYGQPGNAKIWKDGAGEYIVIRKS